MERLTDLFLKKSCKSCSSMLKKNMDIQDAQDNQDGTLLPRELALAMIRNGFANAREHGTTDL